MHGQGPPATVALAPSSLPSRPPLLCVCVCGGAGAGPPGCLFLTIVLTQLRACVTCIASVSPSCSLNARFLSVVPGLVLLASRFLVRGVL